MEVDSQTCVGDGEASIQASAMGHVCLDITRACSSLARFLHTIEKESVMRSGRSVRVLRAPHQSMVGGTSVEMMLISDGIGTTVELLRRQTMLQERHLYRDKDK